MKVKKIITICICILLAGCASLPPVEDNQAERQVIDVYDNQGKVKKHVIIKDDYIRIYDKDWKTKGHGKVQKPE